MIHKRFLCPVCNSGIFEYVYGGGINEINGSFKCNNNFCSSNLPDSDIKQWLSNIDYHRILSYLKSHYMKTKQPTKSLWQEMESVVDSF